MASLIDNFSLEDIQNCLQDINTLHRSYSEIVALHKENMVTSVFVNNLLEESDKKFEKEYKKFEEENKHLLSKVESYKSVIEEKES